MNEGNNTYKLKNGQVLEIGKATVDDASGYHEYLNRVGGESGNLTYGFGEFFSTVEQLANRIEATNRTRHSVVLLGKIDSVIVSTGSLYGNDRARLAHHASLALSVSKSHWGLGIGTHTLNAMIEFARNSGILEILHLGVRSDNLRAIAIYERMGFRKIGLFEDYFKIDGVYYDEILMNLRLGKREAAYDTGSGV